MAEEPTPEGFSLCLVVPQIGQQWAEDRRPQRGQFPGMAALDVDMCSAVVQDQSRKLLQHGQHGGQTPQIAVDGGFVFVRDGPILCPQEAIAQQNGGLLQVTPLLLGINLELEGEAGQLGPAAFFEAVAVRIVLPLQARSADVAGHRVRLDLDQMVADLAAQDFLRGFHGIPSS